MKKSVNSMLKLSRGIVNKSTYKKLKKIKEKQEFTETTQHAIVSALKHEYLKMEIKIKSLESQEKDIFFAKNKVMIIPSKIKNLQANFNQTEFNSLKKTFRSAKEEIKNV